MSAPQGNVGVNVPVRPAWHCQQHTLFMVVFPLHDGVMPVIQIFELSPAVLQSAKLKQAQDQAQVLTREKESLLQTIHDLNARIKQGKLFML